jgi:hypothetical protein
MLFRFSTVDFMSFAASAACLPAFSAEPSEDSNLSTRSLAQQFPSAPQTRPIHLTNFKMEKTILVKVQKQAAAVDYELLPTLWSRLTPMFTV